MRNLWRQLLSLLCIGMTLMVGCVQVMDDQPKLDPQEQSSFFADGIASRPLPDHIIAADPATWQVRSASKHDATTSDEVYLTGRVDGEPVDTLPALLLSRFTYPELLHRGHERFDVSCVPCHDATGSGNGMAARRGFPYPPTYHSDRLRSQPLGYFFVVATEGHNKMPPYRDLISTEDRWAIAAYVRALQFSQYADVTQLKEADLNALQESP